MPFGIIESPLTTGSSVFIEELGPSGPGFQPRKVLLLGPSLPFMGAEWASEQNVITTWYPGNSVEATQQVLGPREMPSTWEGVWRRTLMGKIPSIYIDESGGQNLIVNPITLRDILESIHRGGIRLRVTWSVNGSIGPGSRGGGNTQSEDVDVKIVREGRIKTFRTPIDRVTDIRWSMEFHWMSRGGRQDKVATVRDTVDAAVASQALEASVIALADGVNSKIVSIKKNIRRSASHLTLGQLENLANTPTRLVTEFTRKLQRNVSDFKRIGDVANKLRTQPFSIATATVNFARNTTSVANQFLNVMGRRPPEVNSLKSKVSDVLRAQNYFSSVQNAAILNARRGYELDTLIRNVLVSGANRGALTVRASATTRAGEIIAVHISKFGDTPQRVSQKYYGNADQGTAILRSNRLPWYTPTFRPGQILIIPVLGTQPARANA